MFNWKYRIEVLFQETYISVKKPCDFNKTLRSHSSRLHFICWEMLPSWVQLVCVCVHTSVILFLVIICIWRYCVSLITHMCDKEELGADEGVLFVFLMFHRISICKGQLALLFQVSCHAWERSSGPWGWCGRVGGRQICPREVRNLSFNKFVIEVI